MENKVTNLLVFLFVSLVLFTSAITLRKYLIDGDISAQARSHEQIIMELEKSLDQVEKEKQEQKNQPLQNSVP